MKYDDGTVARVGDRVCIRSGDAGVVIAFHRAAVMSHMSVALTSNQSESLARPPNDELFESDVAVSLGIRHFEIE